MYDVYKYSGNDTKHALSSLRNIVMFGQLWDVRIDPLCRSVCHKKPLKLPHCAELSSFTHSRTHSLAYSVHINW